MKVFEKKNDSLRILEKISKILDSKDNNSELDDFSEFPDNYSSNNLYTSNMRL